MALTNGAIVDSETPSEASPTKQLFYQYSKIDKEKRAFRLLILRGGTGHDIDCELVESTIDSNGLPYEAVSYAWGPSFTADIVNINGKKLPVTFNLSLILRDLRPADVDRVIWVDAICINQHDATEKGHQVAQMQDIYASAERVLFCIARPTNYTDLLLSSLNRLQGQIHNIELSDTSAINACWRRTQAAMARHHLNLQLQPSEKLLSVQLEAMTFLQRQGLEWILGQPWFHRVWILQEVANARDALVCCGQNSVSAAIFALGARLLGYSLPDKERHKSVDEVLNLMPGLVRKDPSQDILSLLRRFGKANATVERDRIYALFGVCKDKQIQTHIIPNYIKSERAVIVDTIAYICHCEVAVISNSPYDSIAHFLSDLDLFENTLLSHFLRWKNHKGASSLLQRRGDSISVTSDMLRMAVNKTMMKKGVMSQLLEQHNADSLISGQEGWRPLLFAAEHGYDTLVRQMLEKGAFIEAFDPAESNKYWNYRTPLTLAAMNGHETVVNTLLEKGANMSDRNSYQGMPPAWTARKDHSSVAQLLVDEGSTIDISKVENRTPLSWAASKGHEGIVRLLLKHGADPTKKEYPRDDTPLSRAAENGHRLIVQILIESGTTFDRSSKRFALKCAVGAAQMTKGGLLFEAGARNDLKPSRWDITVVMPWVRDDRQEDFEAIVRMLFVKGEPFPESSNPLARAAVAGNERVVRLFLSYGARVDYMSTRHISWDEGDYSGTALAFAIQCGHKDVAELLLREGAHLEARDSEENTPLFVAARSVHEHTNKTLLAEGAHLEGWKDMLLFVAAKREAKARRSRCEDVVKMLLAKGADTETRANNNQTPLHFVSGHGHENTVGILLENGADIEVRDDDNRTPLHLAAKHGHKNTVRVLLENGADIEARDNYSQTPLHLAAGNGHADSVRLLREKGVDITIGSYGIQSPLDFDPEHDYGNPEHHMRILSTTIESDHEEPGQSHENTVRLLLKNGAYIESRDRDNRTALSRAAADGHQNVVKVLLENGADIDAKDRWDRTPLSWAAKRAKQHVIALLLESGANSDIE